MIKNLVFFGASLPFAVLGHTTNPYLQYTMKGIAKDVELVSIPAKKPNPIDVTEGMILTAIVRARTALYQIQLITDRAGKFEDGKLIKDEMTPGIDEEIPEKQKELMQLYPEYLHKAMDKLVVAEKELQAQFAEKDPEKRNFAPVKVLLTDLEVIIVDAHKLFRPPT